MAGRNGAAGGLSELYNYKPGLIIKNMSAADDNLRKWREAKERQKENRAADRLPPSSLEAEQGVLGCCLLDNGCIGRVLERSYGERVFFDGRHQAIFDAMSKICGERGAGSGEQAKGQGEEQGAGSEELGGGQRHPGPVDVISLQQALKDSGELESVGGLVYLASLEDVVPSVAQFEVYFSMLWEKFLGRRALSLTSEIQQEVFDKNGLAESTLALIARRFEEYEALTKRGNKIAPTELRKPGEFAEGYFKLWFKDPKVVEGWALPFPYPWHGRPHELTLMTGDSGSGKSSFIGHMAVEWMMGEVPVCMASMEVPADVTTWIMSRQLIGASSGHMEKTAENERRLVKPLAWLNARMTIYDFLGITDWRTLLDVFEYAAGQGFKAFFLDSVMRIGIPEDDLAQQALAAAEFANFAVKRGVHLLCVNHVNKGEGSAKRRVSGSKKWTDNANNLVEVERNEKKGQKLAELEASKRLPGFDEAEYKSDLTKWRDQWDSRLVLHKQRFPGAAQNGSRYLHFDGGSLQFRSDFKDPVTVYLEI